ncbi:hypothetical protein [Peribacillus asahii]|uniref:hypothetical protein n=1 Tax=Peribacillus asahii TaxID=228899 RepID=UPI0015FCC175|nr:hypothetical protein [Peribacillus asahii]
MNGINMIVTIVVINVVYVSLFTIRLLFVLKRWHQKHLLFLMNQDIFEADFGPRDYLRGLVVG